MSTTSTTSSTPSSRRSAAGTRSGAQLGQARTAVAPDGEHWLIYERSAAGTPGARAATCLVLDCGAICRRVWRYPHDWTMWTVERLLALDPYGAEPGQE
ncbi:MAG TPA: hypothetical protein VF041_14015 [Gemmatimonadaceae bacterium]